MIETVPANPRILEIMMKGIQLINEIENTEQTWPMMKVATGKSSEGCCELFLTRACKF